MNLFKEKDLENRCGGCGEEHHTEWDNRWDEHSPFFHYKITNCKLCGYEIIIKSKHDNSGH